MLQTSCCAHEDANGPHDVELAVSLVCRDHVYELGYLARMTFALLAFESLHLHQERQGH